MQNPLTPLGWKFAIGIAFVAGVIATPLGMPWPIVFAVAAVGFFMLHAWGSGR